jgi:hypothetical protein
MAKVRVLNRNSILSRTKLDTHQAFIDKERLTRKVVKEFDEEGKIVTLSEPRFEFKQEFANKVYYGAPDIATREMFSSIPEIKFISGTHGDDDCQLYIKPEQDSTIQIESYGMINLSVFFMNQVKLTIAFLELLASDTDLTVSNLIMEYSFSKEYIDGKINKAGLNRTYNFPIVRNNVIDQELNIPEAAQQDEENAVDIALANVVNETVEAPTPPSSRTSFAASSNSGFRNFLAGTSSNFVPRTDAIQALPIAETIAETTQARTRARRRTPAEMALARAEAEAAAIPPPPPPPTTNLV